MSYPVYRFGAVLKEFRRHAGLSILAAAEAVGYGNYERWESGQTRVGAQYLRDVGEAFATTDDLHLLIYAWLIDRLSPCPGEPEVSIGLDELRRHLAGGPETVVDLKEHKHLVVEAGRHVDVALLCLAARYCEHDAAVLRGAERAPLPGQPNPEQLLTRLYGDVLADAALVVGRQLLTAGLDDDRAPGLDRSNIGPLLATPETYRGFAEELEAIDSKSPEPLVLFARGTAADARRFAELLPRLHDQLRELYEAANGTAPLDEEVERLASRLLAGKRFAVLRLAFRAFRRGTLPAFDPRLTAELQEMRDRVRDNWRAAAERQIVADVRDADAAAVFDALETLRRRPSA